MLKPRNSFVVVSIIEKSARQVGAIIVPVGGEAFTEALVVAVPDKTDTARFTSDLAVGQVVWVQHKRPVKGPQGQSLADSFIPYQEGKHRYALLEETQIMGVIAGSIEEYGALQKATHEAQIQAQLLA